jgi:hypothetical protein
MCELKIFFWQRIGCVCRNCYQNYANTVFMYTISLNVHVHVYILKNLGGGANMEGNTILTPKSV